MISCNLIGGKSLTFIHSVKRPLYYEKICLVQEPTLTYDHNTRLFPTLLKSCAEFGENFGHSRIKIIVFPSSAGYMYIPYNFEVYRHESSCYNTAHHVKQLDNGLTVLPIPCTGVIFSFLFFHINLRYTISSEFP